MLASSREALFWEIESYGDLQAEQGVTWGEGLANIGRIGSYSFGPAESAAFGLDAGDAIYSAYSAAATSGFTISDAASLANGGP